MNSKKVLILIIVALALLSNVNAQQKASDYKLSDFKYRTAGYRALELNADLNSTGQKAIERDTAKSNYYSGSLNFKARYLKSLSTEAHQRLNIMYGDITPGAASNRNEPNIKNSNAFSTLNSGWHDFNRIYKKKFFLEYGTDASFFYSFGSEKNNGVKAKSSQILYNAEANGGIGIGRLEQVTDAQTALFILQDLNENGGAAFVDAAMVDKFAHFITSLRNGRVFDLRNRTKFHLKQIDSFLTGNKIIKLTSADEIGIIMDNLYFSFNNNFSALPNALHYGDEGDGHPGSFNMFSAGYYIPDYLPRAQAYVFNPGSDLTIYPDNISEFNVHTLQPLNEQTMRLSGKKIYARVRAVYGGGKNTGAMSSPPGTKGIISQMGIEKHKPVNLKHQENYSANINFFTASNTGRAELRFFQDDFTAGSALGRQYFLKSNAVWLTASYTKGYYPNGRTSIEGKASFYLSKSFYNFDYLQSVIKYNLIGGSLRADAFATYFVSNTTVLKGSAGLYYQYAKEKATPAAKRFNTYVSFNVIHTLF